MSSASSSRTLPRSTGQTPVKARTRVVLPPALGPMTPSPSPAFSSKPTSLSSTRPEAGAATVIFSTLSDATGLGSGIGALASPSAITVSRSRWNACRAATTLFQLPMARSIGASARDEATDEAMMAPADSSPMMVR